MIIEFGKADKSLETSNSKTWILLRLIDSFESECSTISDMRYTVYIKQDTVCRLMLRFDKIQKCSFETNLISSSCSLHRHKDFQIVLIFSKHNLDQNINHPLIQIVSIHFVEIAPMPGLNYRIMYRSGTSLVLLDPVKGVQNKKTYLFQQYYLLQHMLKS